MSRFSPLVDSIAVGSMWVGLRDLNPPERRALFQFVANSPFEARIFATLDFDYQTNVGTNWFDVTKGVFSQDDGEADFVVIGGHKQRRKNKGTSLSIVAPGVYAFDDGFMPGAFSVQVTTITSGDPLKILFGV